MYEITITTVRQNPMTEREIEGLVNAVEVESAVTEGGFPFVHNSIQVGLDTEEEIEDDIESTEVTRDAIKRKL